MVGDQDARAGVRVMPKLVTTSALPFEIKAKATQTDDHIAVLQPGEATHSGCHHHRHAKIEFLHEA